MGAKAIRQIPNALWRSAAKSEPVGLSGPPPDTYLPEYHSVFIGAVSLADSCRFKHDEEHPRFDSLEDTLHYCMDTRPGGPPPTRKMSTNSNGSSQNVPDYDEDLLGEIDQVTVEITAEGFKTLLSGTDIPSKRVTRQAEEFSDADCLQLGTGAREIRHSMLRDKLNVIVDTAGYGGSFEVTVASPETSLTGVCCALALYPDGPEAQEAYLCDTGATHPRTARCAWAWMVIPIEAKGKGEDVAYGLEVAEAYGNGEGKAPLFCETPKGRRARARFVKCASEIMMRQHRTHVYAIYTAGAAVRFCRFDRSGCLVSAPVHLRDNFLLFRDIVYRLLRLSRGDQGFDSTVSVASGDLRQMLRAHQPLKNPHLKRYYQDCFNGDERFYPVYKVKCPEVDIKYSSDVAEVDEEGGQESSHERIYLIGKPISAHPTLTGRCTRGYIAFDVQAKRFVFLKDQWRAVTRTSELDTYQRLHQHRVPCIATPVAGGDIDAQRTNNHRFIGNRKANRRPAERVHSRLVTKEVGRPLETYRGSFDLLRYVACAVAAHMAAYVKAGVLHHDVSVQNILINVENDEAFLNDWDLAKWREELKGGVDAPNSSGVSGTWPYKSALSLQYPFKPAELADDLESFVYILLSMAMRFHRHDLSSSAPNGASANTKNEALSYRVLSVFHQADLSHDGHYVGGYWKAMAIAARQVPIELAEGADGKPTPLAHVLQQCYNLMHDHCQCVNYSELKQYAVTLRGEWPADDGPGTVPNDEDSDEMDEDAYDPDMVAHDLLLTIPLENDIASYGRRSLPQRRPPRSSSPRGTPREGGARPMDSHQRLVKILRRAFVGEDGKCIPIAPYRYDKLYDQCPESPSVSSEHGLVKVPPSASGDAPNAVGETTVRALPEPARSTAATMTASKPAKAAAGAVRRSARLAVADEADAPPAPATGKRKRAAHAEHAVPAPTARTRRAAERPAAAKKTAASKPAAPTRRKARAAPAPPARQSSRLAAKA